jgi:hypothetical protein
MKWGSILQKKYNVMLIGMGVLPEAQKPSPSILDLITMWRVLILTKLKLYYNIETAYLVLKDIGNQVSSFRPDKKIRGVTVQANDIEEFYSSLMTINTRDLLLIIKDNLKNCKTEQCELTEPHKVAFNKYVEMNNSNSLRESWHHILRNEKYSKLSENYRRVINTDDLTYSWSTTAKSLKNIRLEIDKEIPLFKKISTGDKKISYDLSDDDIKYIINLVTDKEIQILENPNNIDDVITWEKTFTQHTIKTKTVIRSALHFLGKLVGLSAGGKRGSRKIKPTMSIKKSMKKRRGTKKFIHK